MNIRKLFLSGCLVVLGSRGLVAQEITSGIFGYYRLTLLGNSDTIVSLPFAQLPATTGLAASYTGNVLQLQGSNNWAAGQFVYAAGVQSNTYYLRFDSGALEGRQYDITNNGANSLSLNLRGDTLSGVVSNDAISIVPYWTLGTVFANGNGIHLTTSQASRKTEVLLPNLTGTGKNLSAAATYYYYSNAVNGSVAWRLIGSSATNRNDDIIPLNTYVTIRHNIASNTTFTSIGDVVLTKIAIPLRANASLQQDNALGLARPIQVSLNDSGLITNGGFVPTTDVGSRKDDLIVFDNAVTNKNKSASATYYYYNSGWRKLGASLAVDYGPTNVLAPGAGFIIRKATNASGVLWTNSPTY